MNEIIRSIDHKAAGLILDYKNPTKVFLGKKEIEALSEGVGHPVVGVITYYCPYGLKVYPTNHKSHLRVTCSEIIEEK